MKKIILTTGLLTSVLCSSTIILKAQEAMESKGKCPFHFDRVS